MDPDELIHRYPRLFHMAEDGAWPSIQARGLLSTRALLEDYGAPEALKQKALGSIRKSMVEVVASDGRRAWVRDQLPLRQGPLEKCLTDLTVAEWLHLLNGHVFFWVRRERLERLLAARPYRNRQHTVIALDTEKVLLAASDRVRLTPMNTGSTIFRAVPRGSSTFASIADFDLEGRKRAGRDAVVEFAVQDRLAISMEMVVSVHSYLGDLPTGDLLG